MPRVSIIIPTYNCARYIGRALDSVCAQTYKDYEILVVDDGSTDDTKDVVMQYGRKVAYLYQQNRGVSAARNHAISQASGELLAYLDADDMWYAEKLEKQVAFLDTHHECGMIHSEISVIDEQDAIIHVSFNQETKRPVPQGHCVQDMLKRSHIQTLTVVERRDCFDCVGSFDERLPVAQDYLHWIRIAMGGWAIGYLGEPLAMYRWRKGSLMGNVTRLTKDLELIYESLLYEKSLVSQFDAEAAKLVYSRLYDVRRQLAYLDRTEGRQADSLRRTLRLIKGRPYDAKLYVDVVKACLPPLLIAKLRMFRGHVS